MPTAAEAGLPGFEIATWFGVVAPAKTPADIVQKLNSLIANISSDPAARKRLEDSYLRPMSLSPDQFKQLVEQDAKKWSAVVTGGRASTSIDLQEEAHRRSLPMNDDRPTSLTGYLWMPGKGADPFQLDHDHALATRFLFSNAVSGPRVVVCGFGELRRRPSHQ